MRYYRDVRSATNYGCGPDHGPRRDKPGPRRPASFSGNGSLLASAAVFVAITAPAEARGWQQVLNAVFMQIERTDIAGSGDC